MHRKLGIDAQFSVHSYSGSWFLMIIQYG